MMNSGVNIKLKSVFPPDTFTAWSSIFTGLNPAKHGILYTADVFQKSTPNLDTSILRGITFWDIAGRFSKKVCVLFPSPLIFPPWQVNGVMVSKSWENKRQTFPPSFFEKHKAELSSLDAYGPVGGFKRLSDIRKFSEHVEQITLEEARFGLRVSEEYEWDLFFIFFEELDQIEHFFWRYYDESDPAHPSNNPYKNTIRNFYCIFDRIVGEFIKSHEDVPIVTFSDHGHGMRPPKTVNVNELLRLKGLLFSKASKLKIPYFVENVKKKMLDFVHRYELDYQFVKLARIFPKSKDLYTSTFVIDWERTIAYLSGFAGPKSYSHGGIEIKKENIREGMSYEDVRELLIKDLSELINPQTNEKLVKWACKREDLYYGAYVTKYPDIVFELKDGYGVYWSVHTPIIGTAYEHNLASGGHKKDAVFLTLNIDEEPIRIEASLMDIAPTVLHLLGIKKNFGFDGRNIFH